MFEIRETGQGKLLSYVFPGPDDEEPYRLVPLSFKGFLERVPLYVCLGSLKGFDKRSIREGALKGIYRRLA